MSNRKLEATGYVAAGTQRRAEELGSLLADLFQDAGLEARLAIGLREDVAGRLLQSQWLRDHLAAADRVSHEAGFKEGYDERWERRYQDLRALRRQVTKDLGPGFLCHACGRPIDEGGCQYRRDGGFMDTKVHLIDPSELARTLGNGFVPIDTVGDAEYRAAMEADRT